MGKKNEPRTMHIRITEDGTGPALCGYIPMENRKARAGDVGCMTCVQLMIAEYNTACEEIKTLCQRLDDIFALAAPPGAVIRPKTEG